MVGKNIDFIGIHIIKTETSLTNRYVLQKKNYKNLLNIVLDEQYNEYKMI